MLVARFTPPALLAGVLAMTSGAGPVRNVQLVAATGLPAVSVAPVIRAVYLVSAARLALGFRVTTLVAAL